MNSNFAELLGKYAGDGTIYQTSWYKVWELRGGNDEKEFYDKYVVPLLKTVYEYDFKGKPRSGGKNGCYGVRCCQNAFIHTILTEGFPVGKKTKTVTIPKNILQGDEELKCAFLRGLFATDLHIFQKLTIKY